MRIEIRHVEPVCSTCGAGSIVSSALRPEYEGPLPVDGDTDLAAELAGLDADVRELLGDLDVAVDFWIKRKARQEVFAGQVGDIVRGMSQLTVRGS